MGRPLADLYSTKGSFSGQEPIRTPVLGSAYKRRNLTLQFPLDGCFKGIAISVQR